MGSVLIEEGGNISRVGPVLQRGIVAAVCPFEDAEPHAYLIDVMTQGGASGSPVFRIDNGEVIGVVHSRQHEQGVGKAGCLDFNVLLPTNFSHAVPSRILSKLIEAARGELMRKLPPQCPSISDIISSITRCPTDKITRGSYSVQQTQGGHG